jgi:hypothetical protein
VGLVAGIAQHTGRVLRGYDLRKSRGLGRILFMAAAAEIGDVRQFGHVGRILGVFGERSVAGFASDVGVLAGGADLGLVVVAHHAGVLPGISDRTGTDQLQRAGAGVAVLAEALGDYRGADYQKSAERAEEDHCWTKQVHPIAKQTLQNHPRKNG